MGVKAALISFDRVIFNVDVCGIHVRYKSIEDAFQIILAVMELLLENFTFFSLNFVIRNSFIPAC